MRRPPLSYLFPHPYPHTFPYPHTQGMNRLAAIPLLILPDEETAFWCLVAIIDRIMPESYFGSALLAAQADQRVLKVTFSFLAMIYNSERRI